MLTPTDPSIVSILGTSLHKSALSVVIIRIRFFQYRFLVLRLAEENVLGRIYWNVAIVTTFCEHCHWPRCGRFQTDFMALLIRDGYPVLLVNLGDNAEEIRHERYVADDRWHQIIVDRWIATGWHESHDKLENSFRTWWQSIWGVMQLTKCGRIVAWLQVMFLSIFSNCVVRSSLRTCDSGL